MELFDPIQCSLEMPPKDICARAVLYNESPELLASLCCMYHLCRLLVHASMVPSLSGCPLDPADAAEPIERHIEGALHQATAFVEIMQQFVDQSLDMTKLWHFTGYGAFVVGSLLVVRSAHIYATLVSIPCATWHHQVLHQ